MSQMRGPAGKSFPGAWRGGSRQETPQRWPPRGRACSCLGSRGPEAAPRPAPWGARRQQKRGMGKKGDGCGHASKRRHVRHSLAFANKSSCAFSTLSRLTCLRKLAPHFSHIEPSPIFHPPFFWTLGGSPEPSSKKPDGSSLRQSPARFGDGRTALSPCERRRCMD